jgi:hypothetical protein
VALNDGSGSFSGAQAPDRDDELPNNPTEEVNHMNIKRKLAMAAAGVLSIMGVGVGAALAQTPASSTPPPSASAQAPTNATADPNAPEALGTEAATPEDPGDVNLPGGGHADPAGQNVDHQFDGVE